MVVMMTVGIARRLPKRQIIDHFVDVASLSPIALASQIYADGIDILVDLVGYNGKGRLQTMALRPAPLTDLLTQFCLPNRTGMSG